MKTPICDFVKQYAQSNALKLHMPGHKGVPLIGVEQLDITEIDGADSLYQANGIIAESESNASALFGYPTYYSTEGSSQCIKAMMHLLTLHAKKRGQKPLVLSARNAHKAFHSAVALLDLDVEWLYPQEMQSYLSCDISADELSTLLKNMDTKPTALYVTSPDYLGNALDIASLAKVCHENDILLAVDNAHGAYLKFLPNSRHPMDLGADICCDSAHKTLPVLTGGAYLHLSIELHSEFSNQVKQSLELFGSTSPSYLILQSLDATNAYLQTYPQKLADFTQSVDAFKQKHVAHGYELYGDEPLKVTIKAKPYGYTGCDLAKSLANQGAVCEFFDQDFVVLMLTPEILPTGLNRLQSILLNIAKLPQLADNMPPFHKAQKAMSIRQAMLSPAECLPVDNCLGRVVASPTIGCPPAVPIIVSGEVIDKQTIDCFHYYGIQKCSVVL